MAERFDVVVVGAGVAGCVVAGRLSDDPGRSVLLLESGPDLRVDRRPAQMVGPNHLRTAELTDRWEHWPATEGPAVRGGRGVGGGAAVNGMVAIWAPVSDYDRWGTVFRATDWSGAVRQAAMAEVQSVLGSTLLGRSRWGAVSRALSAAGKANGLSAVGDPNTGEAGVGSLSLAQRDGQRFSVVEAWLEPARQRANLTVGPQAEVRRVLIEGRAAIGVELVDGTVVEAGAVIVCAGAIGSPVLLRRSGLDRPGIGSNLHDHPSVLFPLTAPSVTDPEALVSGSILRTSLRRELDLMILPLDHLGTPDGRAGLLVVALDSRARGTVAVDETDVVAVERPDLTRGHDLELLWEGWKLSSGLARLMESDGVVSTVRGATMPADIDGLAAMLSTEIPAVVHLGGTCRLGAPDDDLAVVDGHGQVIGVDGLFVADASVIPEPLSAPPMLTVAMVADQVARRLAARSREET
jgi:choline dehydrogenase/5-(hydroxymethyl)furfural/furfural oxidase